MWNPFSKESVLRDLRRELNEIEAIDAELLPFLGQIAELMPQAPPHADLEPFWLGQRLMEIDNFVRGHIQFLENGDFTVGQTRAKTAFLAGNVRELRRQLTLLKRKDYWGDAGEYVRQNREASGGE